MSDTNIERRSHGGVTQLKMHRVNGESTWMDSVDARSAAKSFPDEWSFHPFSKAEQTEALKTMPFTDRAVAVPSESSRSDD